MYNINKYRFGEYIKVKDLITELVKENPEAQVTICGENSVHIHVEEDNSVVTLDTEDLSESYYGGNDIDLLNKAILTQDRALEMLKIITENLIEDGSSEVIKSSYKDLGFSNNEIMKLYDAWRIL